jgi:hypothetical protein
MLRVLVVGALLSPRASFAAPPAVPPPGADTTRPATPSSVTAMLADEIASLEREIAARMLQRPTVPADRRGRVELEIDLRIVQRTAMSAVIAASANKADPNDQAAAFLRAKQVRDAARAVEEALAAPSNAVPTPSQREGIAALHKLSFTATGAKEVKELDDFCRQLAVAMVGIVNATPVDWRTIPLMRPRPQADDAARGEHATSVSELADQVQKLAAISQALRQQLLALADAAANAKDKAEAKALYDLLNQAVGLARGLQSNTAVTPEQRLGIETQLTEGVVLFADPRTRDAGKTRLDALGQYRQVLTRIGKMGLSKDQMEQLAPALAFAQSGGETGAKLLATIEHYMDLCARWDARAKEPAIPANLKRAHDDAVQQFARQRAAFMQDASKVGGANAASNYGPAAELDNHVDEIKRLHALTDDIEAMTPSLDTINAFKIRPVGGIEKKVVTAALAAVSPVKSPNRTDAERYLNAVHDLATLSQRVTSKPLTDIPPGTAQSWAGGRIEAFESRAKNLVIELASTLVTGAIELDKAKVARIETAMSMGDALRRVVKLEAALAKTTDLPRWVDWSIDPGALQLIIAPYREATAAAFSGYATDNLDAVDRWQKLHNRYLPLIALISRDVAYADQCQAMPIGFAGDAGRLITPFDDAPFAAERFASYAINLWAAHERAGEYDAADRVSVMLAKRLNRDLRLNLSIEDATTRPVKKRF